MSMATERKTKAMHTLHAFLPRACALAFGLAAAFFSPAAQAQSWAPMATISGTTSLVTNSLCYTDGTDMLCDGNGPANLANSVSVTAGLSGSIIYRDQIGALTASSTFSISSSTGSIGIGAGAPVSMGNNGLYATGYLQSGSGLILGAGGNSNQITGHSTQNYIAFTTAGTEAARIVSSGFVGFGTSAPSATVNIYKAVGDNFMFRIGTANTFLNLNHNHIWSTGNALNINNSTTQNIQLIANPIGNKIGIGFTGNSLPNPSTTLHVSGTIRMADSGETCDTNRLGAIKYTTNEFYLCRNGASWESFTSLSNNASTDRIVSTSANITAGNGGGTISFTTGGVSGTAYLDNTGRFVAAGVSTTGAISGSNLYATGNVGLGTAPTTAALLISGTTSVMNSSGTNVLSIIPFATSTGIDIKAAGSLQLWSNNIRRMAMPTAGGVIFSSSTLPTSNTPSVTVQVSGTIRISDGGETCDANRVGAIKYAANEFSFCRNGSSWETLTTIAAPTISTGLSGSIVYRDSTGNLMANNTFSISSTTGSIGIGAGAPAAMGNNGLYTSGSIATGGAVSVGATSGGSYTLYIAGNAYTTGTWGTSDRRFKENIQPLTGLLNTVTKLRPVSFTWKKNAFPAKDNPGEQIGLIAQEVEKIFPEMVKTNTDGYKAVSYDRLSVLILGAVQELKIQNERLMHENTALEANQANILKRLEALEKSKK